MSFNVAELMATYRVVGASAAVRDLDSVQKAFDQSGAAAGRSAAQLGANDDALLANAKAAQTNSSETAKQRAAVLSATAAAARYTDLLGQENVSLARLASAEASVVRAMDKVSVSTDAGAASMKGYSAATTTAAASSETLGSRAKSLAAMAGQLGLMFGAFEAAKKLIDITKESAAFQKSMLLVQTEAGASASQVKGFSKQILALAGPTATAPDDLATSLYHVYSAMVKVGATGPQMMNTVKVAAEGAKIGMADVEDTTNSLTATLSSGIVPFDQAAKAMGYLNAIVGAGDMKFSDLNNALGTGLLVTMKTFGVSLEDTGAALAVYGDNNVRGADAATKLRMSVQDLLKPAANADKVLGTIGITADQLRASMEQNGLSGTLDLLSSKMTQAGITGSKVGGFLEDAFTKKAGAGLAILLTRLDQFHEAQEAETKAANSFGSAWNATTQTAGFAFKQLGAEAQAEGIVLTEKLLPGLTKVAVVGAGVFTSAIKAGSEVLHPFGVAAEYAGTALEAVAHVVGDVLGDLGPLAPEFKAVAQTALIMWAAFKGYQIAQAALFAVTDGIAVLQGRAASALTSMQVYGQGVNATLASIRANSACMIAPVSSDSVAFPAAAMQEAAAAEAAGARIASAYADQVAASSAATDVQVANAIEMSAAQNAAATSAATAATETAIAAETAAAAVDSAGETAALGWAEIAGPIGIAVAGAAILATSFLHMGSAAKTDSAEVQALTNDIEQNSGALGENARATVANALIKAGAGSAAKTLGLSLSQITTAALQGGPALADITKKLDSYKASVGDYAKGNVTQVAAANKLLVALGDQSGAVQQSVSDAKDYKAAMDTSAPATESQASASASAAAAAKAQAAATAELVTQLQNLAQTQIAAAQSEDQFKEGLLQVSASVKTNGDSLSSNTTKGLANRDMLLSLLSGAVSLANAQQKNGQSVDKVSASLANNVRQIEATAAAAGMSKSQVAALVKQMGLTPKQIGTKFGVDTRSAQQMLDQIVAAMNAVKQGKPPKVDLNTAAGKQTLDQLQDDLAALKQNKLPGVNVNTAAGKKLLSQLQSYINSLHGKTVTITTIQKKINESVANKIDHLPGSASGTNGAGLPEGVSAVGERGPELAVKSGANVQILSNSQSKSYLSATGMKAPGFAGGTIPGFASGTSGTAAAVAVVVAAIVAALKQAPTSVAGTEAAYAPARAKAVSTQASAAAALASYTKLEAEATKLTAAANASQKAANAHALALSNEAHAAAESASKMSTATAADKAAKAAAQAHAKTLADEARTASQAASALANSSTKQVAAERAAAQAATDAAAKAKTAYDATKQAAESAAEAAKSAAQSVVDAINTQFASLQSTVTDFESSISQGIVGDDSLTTMWGNLSSAVDTATTNLSSANDALTTAQQAVADATTSGTDLTGVYAAQTTAEQNLVTARQALTAATANGVAGSAAVVAAQNNMTNATSALAAANAAVASAQSDVQAATGPTADQLATLATAQQAATDAQTAYNAAVAANGVAGLQASLSAYLAQVKGFSKDLTALAKAGANTDLISQIVGMGDGAGDALAQELLKAGPKAIKALQDTMGDINKVAGSEATSLASSFFGNGASTLESLAAGIVKAFPEFAKTVNPIIKQIEALFTFTATVSPTASSGKKVKGHAAGGSVADGWFTAGEAGWELGYKSGSNVQFFPHAQSQAMTATSVPISMSSDADAMDRRAMLTEMRATNARLADLGDRVDALAPKIGQAVGSPISKQLARTVRGAGNR